MTRTAFKIAVLACLYAREKADIAHEMGVSLRDLRRIERESKMFLTPTIITMIDREIEIAKTQPDYPAAVAAVSKSGFGARLGAVRLGHVPTRHPLFAQK